MIDIARVIVWQNGMVMTFDHAGQQVPEYQGRKEVVLPLIRQHYAGPIEGEHVGGMDWIHASAVDRLRA